jgi:uncharacterized protein YqeY
MSLELKVQEEIKDAMRAKDSVALLALRALKSAIIYAKTAEGQTDAPLTADQEMALVIKQVKQRRDSIDQFRANNREDLAVKEVAELAIIERFLPKQLNEAELHEILKGIIAELGASSIKDMGKVIATANQRLAGQAEGKAISAAVKGLLS